MTNKIDFLKFFKENAVKGDFMVHNQEELDVLKDKDGNILIDGKLTILGDTEKKPEFYLVHYNIIAASRMHIENITCYANWVFWLRHGGKSNHD